LLIAAGAIAAYGAVSHLGAVPAGDVQSFQAETSPRWQLFQGDGATFMLTEPLVYRVERTNQIITVPAGFVTDFASVPWAARSIIDVVGKHSVGAVVHDYLYWDQQCSRYEADLLLHEAMVEYKSSWFEKNAVYYAVRARAGGAWDGNAEERKKGLPRIMPNLTLPANAVWTDYRKKAFDQGVRAEPFPQTPGTPPPYCKLPE
jgi:hypothetical protein